jgi:hypothetical protein
MAPVAKRNHFMTLTKSQEGQISIFFSASLVVFISIIAFVINVGLFVKAKINLQNATDASAWAGAAVQSRQLSKIAYLNWEMRNIYKEWMYKYYVVGSLNVPGVEDPNAKTSCEGGKECTNFRLAPDVNALLENGDPNRFNFDDYNFPAVCIHIAKSQTNICKRFAVPGLPEFGGYNIPGPEETSRNFMDGLIGSKVNDCVERSRFNMLVTTSWAYNVLSNNMDATLAGQGPAILTDRQGAWPKAMELAMRIRNLELVMNRPARNNGVCIGATGNCDAIEKVSSEKYLGNERIVKAFYSGYRNLGNETDFEMKNSFTLKEIAPTLPGMEQETSSSSYLIPPTKLYQKQYVDLKLMMVNLATFYAALIPRAAKDVSGACNISKVAIPVPGYPLGFYKNPEVLTYYAVKGEAEFEGMFNPFSAESIKLTAYAAAKPFGGRIGPMLFTQRKNQDFLTPRTVGKFRSVPYLAALDVVGTPNKYLGRPLKSGEFGPGVPLPINTDSPFWIKEPVQTAAVGGRASTGVQFGIPNLVYDFKEGDFSADSYTSNGAELFSIIPKDGFAGDKAVGLFNHEQFLKFRGNIGGTVTPEQLEEQILRVRAPTLYEAANYLIPTPTELNLNLGVDSFGQFPGNAQTASTISGLKKYQGSLYAPLYHADQKDILFLNSGDVYANIISFMRDQKTAMENYIVSLNFAAYQTYKTASTGNATIAAEGAIERYKDAALKISDITDVTNSDPAYLRGAMPQSCMSLAGQFWHFYFGDDQLYNIIPDPKKICPTPLAELLRKYFDALPNDTRFNPTHYQIEYSLNSESENMGSNLSRLFSAYMPGPYNGVSANGSLVPPPGFPQNNELMRRNFYSTKLITLDSVQAGKGYDENSSNFVIHSEGNLTTNPDFNTAQKTFSNPLDVQSAGGNLSSIKY